MEPDQSKPSSSTDIKRSSSDYQISSNRPPPSDNTDESIPESPQQTPLEGNVDTHADDENRIPAERDNSADESPSEQKKQSPFRRVVNWLGESSKAADLEYPCTAKDCDTKDGSFVPRKIEAQAKQVCAKCGASLAAAEGTTSMVFCPEHEVYYDWGCALEILERSRLCRADCQWELSGGDVASCDHCSRPISDDQERYNCHTHRFNVHPSCMLPFMKLESPPDYDYYAVYTGLDRLDWQALLRLDDEKQDKQGRGWEQPYHDLSEQIDRAFASNEPDEDIWGQLFSCWEPLINGRLTAGVLDTEFLSQLYLEAKLAKLARLEAMRPLEEELLQLESEFKEGKTNQQHCERLLRRRKKIRDKLKKLRLRTKTSLTRKPASGKAPQKDEEPRSYAKLIPYPFPWRPNPFFQMLRILNALVGTLGTLVAALLGLALVVQDSFGTVDWLIFGLILAAVLSALEGLALPAINEETARCDVEPPPRLALRAERSIWTFRMPGRWVLPLRLVLELFQLSLSIAIYGLLPPSAELKRALVLLSLIESSLSVLVVSLSLPIVASPYQAAYFALSLCPEHPTGMIAFVSGGFVKVESWWLYQRQANGLALFTATPRPKDFVEYEEIGAPPRFSARRRWTALLLGPLALPVLLCRYCRRSPTASAPFPTVFVFDSIAASTVSTVLALMGWLIYTANAGTADSESSAVLLTASVTVSLALLAVLFGVMLASQPSRRLLALRRTCGVTVSSAFVLCLASLVLWADWQLDDSSVPSNCT